MRLIDGDALINNIDGDLTDGVAERIAIEKINAAPTIDATPVVRCYQCRHWYKGHCTEKQIATIKTDPQFYCANGEKRE